MTGRCRPVHGRNAFRSIFRNGRPVRNGPVTVHFLPADGVDDEVRVAYSVGRKVGGAVIRNRRRRQLRAIAAEIASELFAGSYLIGLSPGSRDLTFQQLRERVIDTMRKANSLAKS